jgi:hypothetical protein
MSVPAILDEVIRECNALFKQLLLSRAALTIGGDALSGFGDEVFVRAVVGAGVEIEPMPMAELKQYRTDLPHVLIEVFQGKLMQSWQECLSQLFPYFLGLHFQGVRQFVELKRRDIRVDFSVAHDILQQARDRLKSDFEFLKYSDRVALITSALDETRAASDFLANIHKHVQIRNAFQHRGGLLEPFALRELGLNKISLLNEKGDSEEFVSGQSLRLSIPEFDSLRRSLLMVGQIWRRWNGKHSDGSHP